jgi:hypothetical protein
MRARTLLAAVLGAVALVAPPSVTAPSTQDKITDKGPVGWQLYLGAAACLRIDANGCVIAETHRRGRDRLHVVHPRLRLNDPQWTLRIELDCHVIVDELLSELVDGKVGAPLPGATTKWFTGDLAPGAHASVASLSGSGWVSQARVRLPEVVASPRVGNDGRAFGAGGRRVPRHAHLDVRKAAVTRPR